jgi:hypothetical protein
VAYRARLVRSAARAEPEVEDNAIGVGAAARAAAAAAEAAAEGSAPARSTNAAAAITVEDNAIGVGAEAAPEPAAAVSTVVSAAAALAVTEASRSGSAVSEGSARGAGEAAVETRATNALDATKLAQGRVNAAAATSVRSTASSISASRMHGETEIRPRIMHYVSNPKKCKTSSPEVGEQVWRNSLRQPINAGSKKQEEINYKRRRGWNRPNQDKKVINKYQDIVVKGQNGHQERMRVQNDLHYAQFI